MNRRQFGLVGLIGSFLGVKESRVLATPRFDADGPWYGKVFLTPVERVLATASVCDSFAISEIDWVRHKTNLSKSYYLKKVSTFEEYFGILMGFHILWDARDMDAYIRMVVLCDLAVKKFNLKERYRRGEIT